MNEIWIGKVLEFYKQGNVSIKSLTLYKTDVRATSLETEQSCDCQITN